MATFRVLGKVGAEARGQFVSVGGPRQRRLLAVLLVNNGRGIPVDRLAEAVWSDGESPESPADALRTYVARLRRSVAEADPHLEGLIITDPGAYRLDAGEAVDSIEFEQLVATARSRRAVGDRSGALSALDSALALWTGAAYEEVRSEEWAEAEAIRLEELRIDAEEDLISDRLAMGATADVIPELDAMIRRYPLRERPRRQLMLALYRAGRQAEAVRSYQDFRRELAEETGLETSAEIAELEMRIVAGDPDLLVETTELKGYRLGQKLGEGAFGEVFIATQPSVDRQVAIKVVRRELADNVGFIQRFEAEAQLIARLEHPNIVPLYDYWREPGGAFLVMRYLRGGSAEQLLAERGPLGPDQVVRIVAQIGAALAAAHAAGVVHRDVKPSNVLFDELDNAYLADFGIAVDGPPAGNSPGVSGPPRYSSPEQLVGGAVSPSMDVYSLGVVAFELLTGEAPFADSGHGLGRHKLQDPLPSVTSLRPDLPDGLASAVAKATAIERAERFRSVQELVAAFAVAVPASAVGSERLADPAVEPLVLPNPYKGLRAFEEADAGHFFGREDIVAQLAEMLQTRRFLAVVGPSGAGKSSLVSAGLVPALRGTGHFVASMAPGADPFERLAEALLKIAPAGVGELGGRLDRAPGALATIIGEVLPANATGLLLVIDQFEELFTLTDQEPRRAFVEMLAAAVESAAPLRIVVTLRADFYDRPLADPELAPLVRDNTVALAAIDARGLEQAIVGPAGTVSVTVEPALVGELIAELRDSTGGLPLLQFALTELYEQKSGSVLDLSTYRSIGGVSGALAKRAENIYAALPETERSTVRPLFLRLVSATDGVNDTRSRVLRSELSGVPDQVIDAFGDARLLSFDRDPATRAPTVELAHEALVREWPRLRQWVSEDRESIRALRNLRAAANNWRDSEFEESELHRGARLEADVEVSNRPGVVLNSLEQDFIATSLSASEAEVQRERRQVRRLRRALAVVGVLLLFTIIAGLFALQQEQRADDEAQEARSASALAETRRIAADAVARADTEPRLALLLAAEAYRRAPGPVGLSALQQVLAGGQDVIGYLGQSSNDYLDTDWVGDSIVALHRQGVEVYDADSSELRYSIDQPVAADGAWRPFTAAPLVAFDTSPEASLAAVAMANGDVLVVDLDSGDLLSLDHDEAANSIAFSNSGDLLASGDAAGTVRLWDPRDGSLLNSWVAHTGSLFDYSEELTAVGFPVELWQSFEGLPDLLPRGVAGLSFSADDATLYTGEIPWIRQWDAASGELEEEWLATFSSGFSNYDGTQDAVLLIEQFEVHPTDPNVLVLGTRGDVVHFNLLTGTAERAYPFPTDRVDTNITFVGQEDLLDGHQIVALSDGRIQLLDSSGEIVRTLGLGLARPGGISLAPDGSQVVASGGGAVVRIALDGQRVLAERLEAAENSFLLSVSPEGDLVGQTGIVIGPTLLHERAADGFEPLAPADWVTNNSTEVWPVPDGRALLSAFVMTGDVEENELLMGTVATQEPLNLGQGANAFGWAFSSDGQLMAATVDLIPTVWNAESGLVETTLSGLADDANPAFNFEARSFSFSADDSVLVGTLLDGSYAFWDTTTWQPIDVTEDLGPTVIASYSPDGRWLATVGPDGTIALRAADSLELVHQLRGAGPPEDLGGHVVWSADGRFLLSRFESAVRMWDTESGLQLGSAFPNDEGVIPGGATGDTAQLVTRVGADLFVWNLDVDSWLDIACRAAGRNLTTEEWEQFGPADGEYQAVCSDYPSGLD